MKRLRRNVRPYLGHVAALVGMIALALAVTGYIAVHQRVRFPWEHQRTILAEFSSAQAVTPGQGQTVNVAGVKVGEIGEVRLEQGRAVVEMNIDSEELGPVYRNAHLLLRPKTGLNDMSIALEPGTPEPGAPNRGRLREGDRLKVWNTLPNVNPDEVLAALDNDTRNYLATIAAAGGRGLKGRGPDLRRLIRASEPTFAQTARIGRALADRRAKVARLVTNLRVLSRAAGTKDRELASLVSASTAVFGTIAEREGDLGRVVDRLPGSVGALDRALVATRGFAVDARPAFDALRPTVRGLAPALVQVRPLLSTAEPVVRARLRPLVRDAIPVVRELLPSVRLVNRAHQDLIRTANVLTYVVNEVLYNPPGAEEGYLFHLAWFAHNGASLLSIQDAHGVVWRGLLMVGCSTVGQAIKVNPALAPLGDAAVCP
ncbi:MAG: phospholipid/cholesterol/gamma-HCH transport system substrate-binding protein [Thermoleophilaceae bacterium]|nr:phospholipid/cholesterol/gamma-HCH transport system substrate-binding protein [Thermoleophilaceae bacterium]